MPSDRYLFVDGLRGVAALSVLLFHLGRDYLGLPILEYGRLGVVIFFVLSGFVICHSFTNKKVTASFVGRFALRRSIRLDPVYWFSIALAIALIWLPGKLLSYPVDLPSWSSVGLHLLYLQDLTGAPTINVVFWTLCYEIQFYLVLCLLFYLVEKLSLVACKASSDVLRIYILIPCLLFSLMWPLGVSEWLGGLSKINGLFINLWYMFLLGVFSYIAISNKLALWVFLLALVVLFLAVVVEPVANSQGSLMVAMATSISLYLAGTRGMLGRWLRYRWAQFFGLISYSLYISHDIVGLYIRDTGLHLAAKYLDLDSRFFIVLWVLFSIGCCIAFAYGLYLAIEKPSHALSRKIKLAD